MRRKNRVAAASVTFLAVFLAGCSSALPTIDARLEAVAKPLLDEENDDRQAFFLKTSQPEPYAAIIRRNVEEIQFRFDDNLRTLEIARLRVKQGRLPQITPGLSTGLGGVAAVELNIRQVLFNGDLSKAMFHDADFQAVKRHIELLDALNSDILEDIETYLSYRENLERNELLTDLASRLEKLLSTAETRLEGGIGTVDDVTLFKLELTEVETEALIAKSDADVDLSALENINASLAPRSFVNKSGLPPIEVLAAIAERDAARSNLAVIKEEAEPRVVVVANAGFDTATGSPTKNAGLRVEADPISFGGNTNIMSAEQEVFLAERELERALTDVSRETRRLLQQIAALKAQRTQTDFLVEQTQERLEDFRDQFLAGTSGLPEAAGLVDTLRRSLEQKVEVRYRILRLQGELCANLGHFWDVTSAAK